MEDDFFEGVQTVDELVRSIHFKHRWPKPWIQDRVDQVLELLEEKGLISKAMGTLH
jgi:hypothetical protein